MEEERKLLAMDLGVDCLEHHGILGQKWGIRRYQNEDGSLTEAGKRRYSREVAKEQRVARSIEKSERRMRIKEAKAAAKASEMEAKARILEAKARSKKADDKDVSDKANAGSKDISKKAPITDEERRERNRKIAMTLGIVGGAAAIGLGYKYTSDVLKKNGDVKYQEDSDSNSKEKNSESSKKDNKNSNSKDNDKKQENKSDNNHGSRDKKYAAAKDLEDWLKVAGSGLDFISKLTNTYKIVTGGK